jgi:(p)ppGpp synthase/HD superfamily hydrolase
MTFLTEGSNLAFSPLLLDAVSYAAAAHRSQLRKDGQTPYFAHAVRVCLILRQLFGIEDEAILVASVLHDTIEDTTTDFDDLEKRFGTVVAEYVALLSKDKRLREDVREKCYIQALSSAPRAVQLIKLADILDNILDSRNLGPDQQQAVRQRTQGYLEALAINRDSVVQTAHQRVMSLINSL